MGAIRRKFTLEFKTEAPHRVIDSATFIPEVASELSISQEALYRWVKDERIRLEAASSVNEGPLSADERRELIKVRARSATDLLLRLLVGAPVVTVNSAASLIGRSFVHPNEAVTRLVETGILKQVSVGRRNRAIETPEIIVAFAALERQLAHFE